MSWRRFFERRRRDDELARELEAHLACEIDDLVARGVRRDEAHRRAAAKLGNRTRIREAVYERNSLAALEGWWKGLRYAGRQLRRSPLFTLIAVGSLGLGIGANTAIFSLFDQSLLRTLPIEDPHSLVFLYQPGPLQGESSSDEPDGPSFSYPLFRGLQQAQTPFTAVAAARRLDVTLAFGSAETHVGDGHLVSGNYFDLLGARPVLGRVFGPGDGETPGAHPVAVLGHRYWMSRFAGHRSALGQSLNVNGLSMTIIGVAAPDFRGQYRNRSADIFLPLSMTEALERRPNVLGERNNHRISLLARLKPGITRARAQAEINVAYRAEVEKDLGTLDLGAENEARYRAKTVRLKSGAYGRGSLYGDERTKVVLVMSIAVLVLLIACANVAALQVGRAAARVRETHVRLALGASRGQLVRQFLIESIAVALLGGTLGVLLAAWALPALSAHLPTAPVGPLSTSLDLRALAFGMTASLFTMLVFGLYPALQASRPDVAAALKDQSGNASAAPAVGAFRRSLVAGQIAVSLLLLICAGLFTRTLRELAHLDVGLRVDELTTFELRPPAARYDGPRRAALFEEVRQRLAASPGIRLVSAASVPAIAGSQYGRNITVEGFNVPGDEPNAAKYNHVDVDYFRTVGIPLVAGRDFRAEDRAEKPTVAVVNETFARHFFGGKSPVGRRMGRGRGDNVELDIEIVGVARDSAYSALRETRPPVFYLPSGPKNYRSFYVRSDVPPEQILSVVRSVVTSVDPDLPIRGLRTMRSQLESRMAQERTMSILTTAFATVATLLSGLGLYGALAYNVTRRTREIGIRIALGAGTPQVRRLLGREIALLLAIGGTLGIAGAAGLARAIQGLLFQVRPWDPAAYGAALLALAVIVLAAAYGPARRATRVDPVLALRHD